VSRWIWLPAVAVLAMACSSGSGHPAASVTSPPSVPATNQQPGGLVGVIDQARITAVCTNARAAQTVLSAGGSAVTDPLVADAALLERPPVDPKAAADGAAIRRDLHGGQVSAALNVALTYCRR
jgi:hypothetical protein